MLLGGRVAEQLVFGDLSTGAKDDLLKATEIARAMVRAYAMSPQLGAVSFEGANRAAFLGPPTEPGGRDYSNETARSIDDEVRRVLEEQSQRAAALRAGKRETLT